MGKAKREASARADELLKSYNVKLNPLAGTYRLEDKATNKEVNVDRSGVDVGTGILAKGRRANKLIGKELVRRSSYSSPVVNQPVTKSNESQTVKPEVKQSEVTNTKGTFGVKFGEFQTTPQFQFPTMGKGPLFDKWRPGQSIPTGISPTVKATEQQKPEETSSNNSVFTPSFRPVEEYPEGFVPPTVGMYNPAMAESGVRERLAARPGTTPTQPTSKPSSTALQDYYKFRFNMLSTPRKNYYKTPEAYGKTLPHTEQSEEVINYAKQKAAQDLRDAQPTNWEKLTSRFAEYRQKQEKLPTAYQWNGRTR